MKENNNIDRLFQERFKNFEPPAPAGTWDALERKMDQDKKRPAVLPLWWKLAGVAAVVVVMASVFFWNRSDNVEPITDEFAIEEDLNEPDSNDGSSIKDGLGSRDMKPSNSDEAVNEIPANDILKKDAVAKENTPKTTKTTKTPSSNTTIVAGEVTSKNQRKRRTTKNAIASSNSERSSTAEKSPTKNLNEPVTNAEGDLLNNKPVASKELKGVALTNAETDSKLSNSGIAEPIKKTANTEPSEDLAAMAVNKEEDDKEAPLKKWSAATVVAPVYASSLSGSSINERVSRSNQNNQTDLSYGVALSYNVDSRWSIRTGVHQVNMNYSNENINYGLNASTLRISESQATAIYSPDAVNAAPASGLAAENSFAQELQSAVTLSNFKGELSQRLGYLEIPLEVKYRLLDKKFGISVLGGFSALLLTDNEVSIDNNGRRLELGADTNFQDFNQSANFGLGLDYQFSKSIGLSLEPTFKYQLNALRDDSADFRPYTIGVYTGLFYRF